MANPEHVRLVRWGRLSIFEWQQKNPGARLELDGADLRGWLLNEADLRGADLRGSALSGSELGASNFSRANLREANLRGAYLKDANLCDADLSWANLSWAYLRRVDFRQADLSGANLNGANLMGANLSHANLRYSDLREANLSGSSFRESNLWGARLGRANLSGADLSGANLSEADFCGAVLHDVNIDQAVLGWTSLGDIDLSEVRGLDSLHHWGPSSVGMDTWCKSSGKIPESFLRSCGLPDEFVGNLPKAGGREIDFRSSLIVCSREDQEFATRLQARMRREQLRVWCVCEGPAGSKKQYESIFDAVRLHNTVLVVLSAQSNPCAWVIPQIRCERRLGAQVVFPLRLCDVDQIKGMDESNADCGPRESDEGCTDYFLDFANWANEEAFERAWNSHLLPVLRRPRKIAGPAGDLK